MNGRIAKKIRKQVYGSLPIRIKEKIGIIKRTKQFLNPDGEINSYDTFQVTSGSKRREYKQAKKMYKNLRKLGIQKVEL